MKQLFIIFINFICWTISFCSSNDVNHVIIDHKGNSIVGIIDSIDLDNVYYKSNLSMDEKTKSLNKVYYIFNDYDRIFHYDWSFYENMRRIRNRPGELITIYNDTIKYKSIDFTENMIEPEILINGVNDTSFYIPMLKTYKIKTDFSIMEYSVSRGFWYSFSAFILGAAIDVKFKREPDRRYIPNVWDQYNDLLPKVKSLGIKSTGSQFSSLSYLIPISVLISMGYDIYKDKRSFYFHPIKRKEDYPRSMYVFSFKNIVGKFISKRVRKFEKSKIGNYLLDKIKK